MGITPITDAMGLSEQIIPSAGTSRVNTDQGSDFRSIWNDQAKGISAGTNPAENTGADRKPKTGDIAYKRSDGTKTDVRSRESSETASETNISFLTRYVSLFSVRMSNSPMKRIFTGTSVPSGFV